MEGRKIGLESIMYNERMVHDNNGTPTMWMEIGRVKERERWKAFTCELLSGAIASELNELKHRVAKTLQSLPPSSSTSLTHCLLTIVDTHRNNINSILGDYIKSVSNDSKIDKAHNDVVNASMEGDSKQSIPNEVDSKQSMPKEVDSKPSIPNETQIGMNIFQSVGLFVGFIILMRLL